MASHNQTLLRQTLERSIHRLLRAGKVFAVVAWDFEPFELPPGSLPSSWSMKLVRVVNAVYSVAVIAMVLTATVTHEPGRISTKFFAIRLLYLAEDASVNVIVLLAVFGSRFLRAFSSTFYKTLVSLGHRLHGCGALIEIHQLEKIIGRLLLVSVLYFIIVSSLAYLLLQATEPPYCFVCRIVLYILPSVMQMIVLYQHFAMQWTIYHCYRSINVVLKRKVTPTIRRTGHNDAHFLDVLRKTHLKLHHLSVRVNDHFGPLTVCTVLSSIVVLILQLFNIYKLTTARGVWIINYGLKLTYILLWTTLHCAKVLLILYPIHRGRLERDLTGPILYGTAQDSSDSTDNEALMRFSGQLLHCSGHHTACGLITLDLALVSKMLAALTTYLVILIQFDSAFT
uniref:Gustatory receptor n=1 Tax=Anopheles dirus TaxID=7168 RepID=A0A182NZ32_9DIPT